MELIGLFPTHVFIEQNIHLKFSEENKKLKETIDAKLEENDNVVNRGYGYQTPKENNLLDWPEATWLKEYVLDKVKTICKDFNYLDSVEILDSWANIQTKDTPLPVTPHIHMNTFLVGSYYPQAMNTVPLQLHNPVPAVHHISYKAPGKNFNPTNAFLQQIAVETGTLVLFPGYISHSVTPHDGSDMNRYCIAMNIVNIADRRLSSSG